MNSNLIDTSDDIYIDKFINNINNLGNEQNKKMFIENYIDIKSQINMIDNILNKTPLIDQNLDICILFEMLNEYTNIINDSDIKIIDYKNIMDLVSIIETKLKNEKMKIIEIS